MRTGCDITQAHTQGQVGPGAPAVGKITEKRISSKLVGSGGNGGQVHTRGQVGPGTPAAGKITEKGISSKLAGSGGDEQIGRSEGRPAHTPGQVGQSAPAVSKFSGNSEKAII